MKQLLVVEDQPGDLSVAMSVANAMGIASVEARSSVRAAQRYLEGALECKVSLPDAIVLDLDLGFESGHELLRFWHSHPELSVVRLVVWTVLGDEQREICRLFGVHAVVSKWEGAAALRTALESGERMTS